MAQLPNIPLKFAADLEQSVRARRIKLGDRQEQRVRTKRAVRQKWALRWGPITEAEKETLRNYFLALQGWQNFEWTPPGQGTELSFKCTAYSETPLNALWMVEIQAEQTFNTTALARNVALRAQIEVTTNPAAPLTSISLRAAI